MDHYSSRGVQQFNNNVGIKFQLYNSLFSSLPFHRIEKTGILLSLLFSNCEEGYKNRLSPAEIIVLLLITIQQFAISKIRMMDEQLINHPLRESYEKLVIRSSFGIINAGRNSA